MPDAVVVLQPGVHRHFAQLDDTLHRLDTLGTDLYALETVSAVPHAAVHVEQVNEALLGLVVARVGGKAVGLGERGRPEELVVYFEHGAFGDAGTAHDAVHHAAEVLHVRRWARVFAAALRRAGRLEVGLDGLDLVPERLHIHDEVADDGLVAQSARR